MIIFVLYYFKCVYIFFVVWNLKFNLVRECGYFILELNEDDRRKVEEIKVKLFGFGRIIDLCKV